MQISSSAPCPLSVPGFTPLVETVALPLPTPTPSQELLQHTLVGALGQLLVTSVAIYAASFAKNTLQAILAALAEAETIKGKAERASRFATKVRHHPAGLDPVVRRARPPGIRQEE